jgi:hypothetical protein
MRKRKNLECRVVDSAASIESGSLKRITRMADRYDDQRGNLAVKSLVSRSGIFSIEFA